MKAVGSAAVSASSPAAPISCNWPSGRPPPQAGIHPRIVERQESTGRLRRASQKRGQMRRQGLWPTEPARARKPSSPGESREESFSRTFSDVEWRAHGCVPYLFPASAESQQLESELPVRQARTHQELARRRHQRLAHLGQKRRQPGLRHHQHLLVFRVSTCPVCGQHRLGAQPCDQRQAEIRHMAAGMLDNAERPRLAHRFRRKPQLLPQFAEQLAAQIDRAVGRHGTRIHAARRRQLPHARLVDRGAMPPSHHHASRAAQHAAHRERPHAKLGEQPGLLHLRDNTAVLGQMAGDQAWGDDIGAEHAAVEHPPRPAGSHAPAGRLPQTFHLPVHGRRQFRHGARDAHHDVRRHLMHDKSVHRLPFLPGMPIVRPDQPKEAVR